MTGEDTGQQSKAPRTTLRSTVDQTLPVDEGAPLHRYAFNLLLQFSHLKEGVIRAFPHRAVVETQGVSRVECLELCGDRATGI